MNGNTHFFDGVIYISCTLLSMLISWLFFDIQAAMWAAFSIIYNHYIFSAHKGYKNFFYSLSWVTIVLLAMYVGNILQEGIPLYILLFLSSIIYFIYIDSSPVITISMKYVIIMLAVGVSFQKLPISDFLGFYIGCIVSNIIYYLYSKKRKVGFFTLLRRLENPLKKLTKHVLFFALLYFIGVSLTVYIPRLYMFNFPYWALLTFVLVFTYDSKKSLVITLQRVVGSIIAALLVYFSFTSLPSPMIGWFSIIFFSFLLPISNGKNYTFVTFANTGLTLSIIEQMEYLGDLKYNILFDRVIETVIGCVVAVCISFLMELHFFRHHREAIQGKHS
ncbi:FUSC family protein [Providencia sneebia]|uniref:Membrane protein n=1 Tax=Providencia sneebia DSM 19967 TaxID=1141660 RepID=K8VXY0_9GAMM|nr:FUSC family protein [Providencia sneebia]EKT53098.1 membrane protein [Providencia sneebia DSM 19967]